MKSHRLPHALIMALVAVAATAPAVALPPSTDAASAPVIEGEPVADAELASISGKNLGANMLVGLRVDLVSNLANAQGGSGTAAGSLYIMRTADGFDVRVHSQASAAGGGASPATGVVGGGEQLQVSGIGQVSQIAGDGNRMANVAVIGVTDNLAAPEGFNGLTGAEAGAGDMTARVTFGDGGVHMAVASPGATLTQAMSPANGGQVMQVGQIAGNGFVANNTMNLQLMTTTMSSISAQQAAIQQALAAVSGLRR